MPADAMPPETKFDLMADLCILAGQAVMQVGSNDLQAAMRVVLGILGQEVAARIVAKGDRAAERPLSCSAGSKAALSKTAKTRRRAAADRLPSYA